MESHSEPPQGATPTQRKQGASPGEKDEAEVEDGKTTNTEQPKPTARATEPHDPEPQPENEADGATADGQAPSGNATSKPPEEAHHDTKADERRANEARHTRPPTANC